MTAARHIMPTAPDSKARLRLWLRMLKSTRQIEIELRRRLRVEFATTLPRFDMMSALERHPMGLKMSELSDVLMVSNGNVTGIADQLVKDGLAVREQVAGDRRASRLRLTRKGQEVFAAQARAHEAWLDELLGKIEGAEIGALTDALQDIPRTAPEGRTS